MFPTDIESKPNAKKANVRHAHGPVQVWELTALSALFLVYLATLLLVGDAGTFAINLAGPVVFGVILLLGSVPAAMRDPAIIWSPLFWFRVATAAYFSFGTVTTFFLDERGKDAIANFFGQYTDLVTKLNAVVTLGALLVLSAAFAVDKLLPSPTPRAGSLNGDMFRLKSSQMLLRLGTVFLILGSIVRYTFLVPYNLGTTNFVLPGSVASLALLGDAGIYMVAVWAWDRRPALVFIPFTLTIVNIAAGLLEFQKTDVMAAIIVFSLAWLSKGVTFRRIAVATGVVAVTFAVIIPFVNSSRIEMFRRYESLAGAGISERLEIASYFFNGSDRTDDNNSEQTGLLRFSYVACGTFALSLYDAGNSDGTLATLPAIFVPRALWPNKPDMTVIGRQFNYMATGNENSASSPGWAAESYWNYGWYGPFIMMIPVGIILQIWSRFSMNVIRNGRWIYFPFCLLGMKLATGIDGFIVPGLFGPSVLALVAYFVVRAASGIYDRTTTVLTTAGVPR